MNERNVVVYAGPTISAEEIHRLLPEATVRPPAARGDLFRPNWRPGDVAVVVDGYFRERRSVGHKEILWVLDQGAEVIGAASMGALRAAELDRYGMRGVGQIYRMFASGEVDGDDEVGILHGPAVLGYPPQTVALVNLRHGCREGAGTNAIPEAIGRRIVAVAKELPFIFRTWPELAHRLDPAERPALATLRRLIDSGQWDLKHLDALLALHSIDDDDSPTPSPRPRKSDLTVIVHNQLLARAGTESAPGQWQSDSDVLDAARLFDDGYPRLHQQTLLDLLAGFAASAGLTMAEYLLVKLGLTDDSPLPDNYAAWLTDSELARLTAIERRQLIMVRVWPTWHSLDWRPAVLARVRQSDSWAGWSRLLARADEAAQAGRHRIVIPAPLICGTLFLRHWQSRGTSPQIEMARRGFASLEELGQTVRRFFAFDLQRGRDTDKTTS